MNNCYKLNSTGAIRLKHDSKLLQGTKHIDVKYHFARKYVGKGMIKIVFVRSEDNHPDKWTQNMRKEINVNHSSKYMRNII